MKTPSILTAALLLTTTALLAHPAASEPAWACDLTAAGGSIRVPDVRATLEDAEACVPPPPNVPPPPGNLPGATVGLCGTSNGFADPLSTCNLNAVFRLPQPIDHEPNNACTQGNAWPVVEQAESNGWLGEGQSWDGGFDATDFSKVIVYQTELFTVAVTGPATPLDVDVLTPSCVRPPVSPSLGAVRSGEWAVGIRLPDALDFAAYTVGFTIHPNDAGTGLDIGNTRANPFPMTATPVDLGSMPIRAALSARGAADHDWFKIHVPPLSIKDTTPDGSLYAELLTLAFDTECSGGPYGFNVYRLDSVERPAYPGTGCAPRWSCIALAETDVFAEALLTTPDSHINALQGSGYSLTPTLSPMYLAKAGVPPSVAAIGEAGYPFCDPASEQIAAALAGGDGGGGLDPAEKVKEEVMVRLAGLLP